MARIRWIDEDDATGELAVLYDRARQVFPGGVVPDTSGRCSTSSFAWLTPSTSIPRRSSMPTVSPRP